MRARAAFFLRWAAMSGLWLLLAGKADVAEVCAAVAGGLLAALAGGYASRGTGPAGRPRGLTATGAWRVLWLVVRDLGAVFRVVAAQARGRRVPGGELVAVPFAVAGTSGNAGRRALAEFAGSLPPGTVVIGVDEDAGELLAHALAPGADPDPLRLGGPG
jgi:multisubunit Na+/H+ antiporter MnhE subunit